MATTYIGYYLAILGRLPLAKTRLPVAGRRRYSDDILPQFGLEITYVLILGGKIFAASDDWQNFR